MTVREAGGGHDRAGRVDERREIGGVGGLDQLDTDLPGELAQRIGRTVVGDRDAVSTRDECPSDRLVGQAEAHHEQRVGDRERSRHVQSSAPVPMKSA